MIPYEDKLTVPTPSIYLPARVVDVLIPCQKMMIIMMMMMMIVRVSVSVSVSVSVGERRGWTESQALKDYDHLYDNMTG